MTATKVLKCLLTAALLCCASAHAEDAFNSNREDGTTTTSFKISEVRCQLVEGQVRCTFGS